jgi:hypothetical protein
MGKPARGHRNVASAAPPTPAIFCCGERWVRFGSALPDRWQHDGDLLNQSVTAGERIE